jgi:hypothetical protein
MDCRVPQSCSLVMERPGLSSPEILSTEYFSPVSGKVLDGWDGLLGCLSCNINSEIMHYIVVDVTHICIQNEPTALRLENTRLYRRYRSNQAENPNECAHLRFYLPAGFTKSKGEPPKNRVQENG